MNLPFSLGVVKFPDLEDHGMRHVAGPMRVRFQIRYGISREFVCEATMNVEWPPCLFHMDVLVGEPMLRFICDTHREMSFYEKQAREQGLRS
jgi:hypothetical protein